LNNASIKTYIIPGTPSGKSYFNLSNYSDFNGGVWEDWYVRTGELFTNLGTATDCNNTAICIPLCLSNDDLKLYPNPIINNVLTINNNDIGIKNVKIYSINGQLLDIINSNNNGLIQINTNNLLKGILIIEVEDVNSRIFSRQIVNC